MEGEWETSERKALEGRARGQALRPSLPSFHSCSSGPSLRNVQVELGHIWGVWLTACYLNQRSVLTLMAPNIKFSLSQTLHFGSLFQIPLFTHVNMGRYARSIFTYITSFNIHTTLIQVLAARHERDVKAHIDNTAQNLNPNSSLQILSSFFL